MQTVTVTSAVELTKTQLDHIQKAIEKKHGKVRVETQLDPSILGGVQITIGSHQIDGSVKTKLDAIRTQLHEYIAQGS